MHSLLFPMCVLLSFHVAFWLWHTVPLDVYFAAAQLCHWFGDVFPIVMQPLLTYIIYWRFRYGYTFQLDIFLVCVLFFYGIVVFFNWHSIANIVGSIVVAFSINTSRVTRPTKQNVGKTCTANKWFQPYKKWVEKWLAKLPVMEFKKMEMPSFKANIIREMYREERRWAENRMR